MTEPPTFAGAEWYHLKDRGDVASVTLNRNCERNRLLETFRRVVIDGQEYTVLGVESWALSTIRKGQKIGLLVVGGRRTNPDTP